MASGNPRHRVAGTDGSDHEFRAKHMNRYDIMASAKVKLAKTFWCQTAYATGCAVFGFQHFNSALPFTTLDPVWELGYAIFAFIMLLFAWDAKKQRGASMKLLPIFVYVNVVMGAVALGVGVIAQVLTPYSAPEMARQYHPWAWKAAIAGHAFGSMSCMMGSYAGFSLYKAVTSKDTKYK